jgi:hypothetical protein
MLFEETPNLMWSKFKLQVRVVHIAPPWVKNDCFSSFNFETQNNEKESWCQLIHTQNTVNS